MPSISVRQTRLEGRGVIDQFLMHQRIRLLKFKRSRDHSQAQLPIGAFDTVDFGVWLLSDLTLERQNLRPVVISDGG